MSHSLASVPAFAPEVEFARGLDQRDPLAKFRDRFHVPSSAEGKAQVYFAGNSLGLQPVSVKALIEQELKETPTPRPAGPRSPPAS